MVEISDIKDRDSLKAWLNALPQGTEAEEEAARRVAVSIAVRAASRLLPAYWHWAATSGRARGRNMTALPILRSLLIAAVAGRASTNAVRSAITAARADAAATHVAADAGATYAAADAAAAAGAAAAAAAARVARAAVATFADAAAAATYAAAATHAATAWKMVRQDCAALVSDEDVFARPLWGADTLPLKDWTEVRDSLGPEWGFWQAWYEQMLDPKGQPPNWEMLERIALIDDAVWTGPVDTALSAINGIWDEFHDWQDYESPPSAPDQIVEEALKKQPSSSAAAIEKVRRSVGENRASLPPTIDGLQELILLEMKRWQESNELNATMPEVCRQQVQTYLVMYEALERMRPLIPEEGLPSVDEAEQIVGLGRLYRDKFAELPRAKADEVVQGIWERAGNAADVGLVFGTTWLLTTLNVPVQTAVVVGSLAFGRKHAGEIIKGAKDYLGGSGN